MWRELILGLSSQCTFFNPATHSQISELEIIFGVDLPEHLKALLLESNGVFDTNSLEVIWSVEKIKTTNLEMRQDNIFRENFMSFDSLFFFGSDIAGNCYGYAISGAQTLKPSEIFNWSHESDERVFIANSLETYLKIALQNDFTAL